MSFHEYNFANFGRHMSDKVYKSLSYKSCRLNSMLQSYATFCNASNSQIPTIFLERFDVQCLS